MDELGPSPDGRRGDDRGDTLVEVLVAIVIIGLAATAILGSLLISISSSTQHWYLANDDTLLRSALDQIKQQVELPSQQSQSKFIDCSAGTANPPSGNAPAGNAEVILSSWTTSGGPYVLSLPTPGSGEFAAYSGYTVEISGVECIAAAAGNPPTIVVDPGCAATTMTSSITSSCAGDSSGILQVQVTVQDPSKYSVNMSTVLRDPSFGSGYGADF